MERKAPLLFPVRLNFTFSEPGLRQTDRFGFQHGLDRLEGVEYRGLNRRVYLDDGQSLYRVWAGPFAAQREVANVDSVFAEDGADASDDTGHVEIAADQEISFEWSFDIDAAEFEEPGLLSVQDGCCCVA